MTGATPNLAFPYSVGGDALGTVDNTMQALATALDTYLAPTNTALVAGTNVNVGTSAVYKRGKWAIVRIEALTATAALPAAAFLGNIPVGYRPTATVRAVLWNFTANAPFLVEALTTGNIQTSPAIANGSAIYGSIMLPL